MSDVAYIGPGGRRRPLLRKLVGDVLRRNRLEQRRTLADVAQDARVSVQYLSEIERGRKEASSEVLGAVCGALRIELAELLAAVGHDLVKDRPAAPAQPAAAEPAAAAGEGERGLVENRAPVVSLDAVRRRHAMPAAGRFSDPVLLAA